MKTRWISLAVLTATVGLLALVPAAQAEVRVGANFRLDADSSPFRGLDQAALSVNPGNPQHVVAVYANYLESTCEVSASLDGGKTWTASFTLAPPAGVESFFKSCNNTVGTSAYVEFGSGQNVYTVATAQKQGPGFLRDSTALLYKSTDGGVTWEPGVVAMEGGPGHANPSLTPGPSYYRPSLGVDRGAGQGGADRVHLVARDLRAQDNGACGGTLPASPCTPMRASVSHDGGQTFSSPVRLGPPGIHTTDFPSKPVVNPDHSVTVAWRTTGVQGLIQVARWTPPNDGTGPGTWGNPVDVTKVTNTGTMVQSHTADGPSTSASYPRMAGNPVNGDIYLVYSQGSTGPTAPDGGYQGADHFISPDSQVWFQRSKDNGATWSTPKRISEQTSFPGSKTHQTRHANISVSPNGQRINVVWHDRRHWYQGPGERNCTHSHIFCEDARLGDTYYSYSTNGGDSFSDPLRVNDRSHNNEVGYDTRPSGYWWFGPQSVTVAGNSELIGWMDSREGNWTNDNEDIYLANVDFDATGNAPQSHIDQPNPVSLSVALSKLGYPSGAEGALIGGLRRITAGTPPPPAHITSSPDPACPAAATTANCPTGPASRNASSVVIVNENDAAGALAGAVLGRANPGPVLLSPPGGLPASVKAEVTRMSPGGAFVVGNTTKLSNQVETDLAAAGVPNNPSARGHGGEGKITRLSGANDAETAALIAAKMDYRTDAEKTAGNPAFDAAVIAKAGSKDAGAAAGLAAARRLPVLYVEENSIPAETQAALQSLNIDKTLVVGGTSSVGATVEAELLASGRSPERLGGADPYDTSQAVVAEAKDRGLPSNVVYAADGDKPMDAALLGGVVARATGMLILAPAPLYGTATAKASDYGLSGISRFFLAGEPKDETPPDAPTITSPAHGSYDTDGSFTVAGTAEAGSTVRLYEGTTLRGEATAAAGGGWTVALSGVPDGPHTYTAKATDPTDNTSSASSPVTVIVDTRPPTVRAVSPASGATRVSPAANVLATFSEPMRANTVTKATVLLVRKGTRGAVPAKVTYDPARRRAKLDPKSSLARGATYTATVTTGARDIAGHRLPRATSWRFKTR